LPPNWQDADSLNPLTNAKSEGHFYVWPYEECARVLRAAYASGEDAAVAEGGSKMTASLADAAVARFCRAYRILPEGNCTLSEMSDPHGALRVCWPATSRPSGQYKPILLIMHASVMIVTIQASFRLLPAQQLHLLRPQSSFVSHRADKLTELKGPASVLWQLHRLLSYWLKCPEASLVELSSVMAKDWMPLLSWMSTLLTLSAQPAEEC
jgi:hypothetical protein